MRRFGIHGGIPRRSSSSGCGSSDTPPRPRRRRRASRLLAGIGLVTTVLVGVGATAGAQPPPNPSDDEIAAAGSAVAAEVDRVGTLIVRVAAADQRLSELDAHVATKREDVNRALVDLQAARDAADAAARAVVDSEQALHDAGDRIRHAQGDFDDFARRNYVGGVNGASLAAFLSTDGPDDLLDRAQVMRLLASGRTAVLDALERARTAEANSHSRARAAKADADAAAAAAEARKADAEAAIAVARAALDAQAAERTRIEQERAQAQTELDRARATAAGLDDRRAEYVAWDEHRRAEEAAADAAAQTAAQAAAEAAARVAADAAARARAAELANGQRPHTQIEDRDRDLAGATAPEYETGPGLGAGGRDRGNPDPADETGPAVPRTTPGTPRPAPRPALTGTAALETVIDRGLSQIGVPYAWGGGDENGPTRGIRDGGVADTYGDYDKVGFDCSGLMIYAFAGIGISLPHYTGYQYTAGTQVPSSQMRRGDMIFYGPNASQHVALYLGDGTMLEAPQSGSHVMISPVRWDGMTPYVVRMVS